jgi:hypothetical protein
MTYNVTLVKLGSFNITQDAVATRLKTLFDDVIGSNQALRNRFDERSRVTWTTSCPDRFNAWDLLIYFVPSSLESIARGVNPNASPSGNGFTTWRTSGQGSTATEETMSEVYANTGSGDADLLGNLAFHEALHNKGHFSDQQLHPYGGLAGDTVINTTQMTPAVRTLMAGILGRNRPQWLGGCSYYNDPLRGV